MEEINQWYVLLTVMYIFGLFFAILDTMYESELYIFLGIVVVTMLIVAGILSVNKKENMDLGMLLMLFWIVFIGIVLFLAISIEFDFIVSSMIYAVGLLGSFILNRSG